MKLLQTTFFILLLQLFYPLFSAQATTNSSIPTMVPTSSPSSSPTAGPSSRPTTRPSSQPSRQPSGQPTGQPTKQPISRPTRHPTGQPSGQPSSSPTERPSTCPSGQPTVCPTGQPSTCPSRQPTVQPTSQPTAQPTTVPSTQPVVFPTSIPTDQPTVQPTSLPTAQPTTVPSAQPVVFPTSMPSGQPTSQPSRLPSTMPSSAPSNQPTIQPTSCPSSQPTSCPTTMPSSQPSAAPSAQPFAWPTSMPSSQPSSAPSAFPSFQPSALPTCQPTAQPSSQPTGSPTRQPHSKPTSRPTVLPSNQPSGQPTGQPSTLPTTCPSSRPTSIPTSSKPSCSPNAKPTDSPYLFPTSYPSFWPTTAPTTQPSSEPSSQPSSQPSGLPTTRPSTRPTAIPTAPPSDLPSSQPSAAPTGIPSSQPTGIPSEQPTGQPSGMPSSQPSVIPSSQPTSSPTTFDNPRYFSCGDQLTCESNSMEDCSFFTGNIVLQCQSDFGECLFDVGSFSVGPNTHVNVTGNCSLVVIAQTGVKILVNSTIQAASVNLTSFSDGVNIYGTINTSGRGPTGGIGAPPSSLTGGGGTYGGSGGRNKCYGSTFSNVNFQVGMPDIFNDAYRQIATNPTFGSGGGTYGGRGGGRIVLNSAGNITVFSSGQLLAEGSLPERQNYGSGSGGGIMIIAQYLYHYGYISVQGGASTSYGAAGGGGRIAVFLTTSQNISDSNIIKANIAGGQVGTYGNGQQKECLIGGAGTVYFQNVVGSEKGYVVIYNNYGSKSYAGTPLTYVPYKTFQMEVSNVNLFGGSYSFPAGSSCEISSSKSRSTFCSLISFTNATIMCQNQTLVLDVDAKPTIVERACGLNADIVSLDNSTTAYIRAERGLFASGKLLEVFESSSIVFNTYVYLNFTQEISLFGPVIQIPATFPNTYSVGPTISLDSAAGNITTQSITADRILVNSKRLLILQGGQWSPMTNSSQSCLVDFNATSAACAGTDSISNLKYVHSLAVSGKATINRNSQIRSSLILFCGHTLTFDGNSTFSANGMGCNPTNGTGAGKPGTFNSVGGGGGGLGGSGGTGYNNPNSGGSAFAENGDLYSGSGGGCATLASVSCNYGSYGGGMIAIFAKHKIQLNGTISANGLNGVGCSGGGAGGSISIGTDALSGVGNIEAAGGTGGSCSTPGGGGGGGYIQMYSPTGTYTSYDLKGSSQIIVPGGSPGASVPTSSDSLFLEYEYSTSSVVAYGSGSYGDVQTLGTTQASAGGSGTLALPSCPPGTGNNPATGEICVTCPVGTYSYGGDVSCSTCSNKPEHATYTSSGVSTKNCPYQCDSGYSTDNCYDQLQIFFFNTLTLGGLVGVSVGILAIILVPLFYYRYKRFNDWGDKPTDQRDFFNKVLFNADNADDLANKKMSRGKDFFVENPLQVHNRNYLTGDLEEDAKIVKIRTLQAKRGKEMRREHRMADSDMVFHACRVNFYGKNHPYQYGGGPWVLSNKRPACLRPMLKKKEYQDFVQKINEAVSWNHWGTEMIIFYITSFIIPPIAALIMREYRKRRAALLVNLIAKYNYACFKCPEQRKLRNSLRIGISPDATLAYLDFLFDEETFAKSKKPLCPLGQTKLPAAFRFAGLGTYYSPYYIDTNDLIFQAVPQTDVTSAFIDEAWISFVVELNTVLRKLQSDGLYEGILSTIQFLSDPKSTAQLGGLIVEFCTFNNVPYMEDPAERAEGDDADDQDANEDDNPTKTSDMEPTQSFAEPTRGSFDDKRTFFARFSFIDGLFAKQPTTKPEKNDQNGQEKGFEMSASDKSEVRPEGETITTMHAEAFNPSTSYNSRESSAKSLFFQCCRNSFALLFNLLCCVYCRLRKTTKPDEKKKNSVAMNYAIRDPTRAEQIMSFPDACKAIRRGDLTMGIVISHPKVLNDVYIATEEDYESGDDEDEITTTLSDDEGDLMKSPEKGGRGGIPRSYSVDSEGKSPATSSDSQNPLVRAYGEKADQMTKFYRIMMNAENPDASNPVDNSAVNTNSQSNLFGGYANSYEPSYMAATFDRPKPTTTGSFDIAPTPAAVAIPIDDDQLSSTSASPSKKLEGMNDKEDIDTMTSFATMKEKRRASLQTKIEPVNADSYTEFSRQYPRTHRQSMMEGDDEGRRPTSVDITRYSGLDNDPLEKLRSLQNSVDDFDGSRKPPRFDDLTEITSMSRKRSVDNDGAEDDRENEDENDEDDDEDDDDRLTSFRDTNRSNRPRSTFGDADNNQIRSGRDPKYPSFSSSAPIPINISSTINNNNNNINRDNNNSNISVASSQDSYNGSGLASSPGTGGSGGLQSRSTSDADIRSKTSPVSISSKRKSSKTSSAKRKSSNPPALPKKPPKKAIRKIQDKQNLAPSCLQQKIKPWRITDDEYIPKTDGKLGSREIRRRELLDLDEEDDENNENNETNNNNNGTFDIESKSDLIQDQIDNSSVSTGGMHSSSGRSSQIGRNQQHHHRDDSFIGRDSTIFPNFMQLSFSAYKHEQQTALSKNLSNHPNHKENNNNNYGNSQVGGRSSNGRSSESNPNRRSFLSAARSPLATTSAWWFSLQRQFQYLYYNGFFLYYFKRFMLGCNVAPIGPKYFRKLFEFVVFVLCLSDLALWIIMLVGTYCASDNTTACNDHNALILVMSVWPGAFVIAPLTGLTAVLLGPSGTLARSYGLWSRLAAINNALMIFLTVKYFDYYSNLPGSYYLIIAVTSSRAFQCTFVDLYIAHIERLRYTRGWDGLHTSLFKTKDNKKEIGL